MKTVMKVIVTVAVIIAAIFGIKELDRYIEKRAMIEGIRIGLDGFEEECTEHDHCTVFYHVEKDDETHEWMIYEWHHDDVENMDIGLYCTSLEVMFPCVNI